MSSPISGKGWEDVMISSVGASLKSIASWFIICLSNGVISTHCPPHFHTNNIINVIAKWYFLCDSWSQDQFVREITAKNKSYFRLFFIRPSLFRLDEELKLLM